jgi:hypothetical protein
MTDPETAAKVAARKALVKGRTPEELRWMKHKAYYRCVVCGAQRCVLWHEAVRGCGAGQRGRGRARGGGGGGGGVGGRPPTQPGGW